LSVAEFWNTQNELKKDYRSIKLGKDHIIHYIMFAGRELVVYGRINVSMVCIDYTAVNL
jgi:hypothetical protein